MKLAINELKGELERNRYVEKQRGSQTFKITCGPVKLGRILTEMANGPTQATLCDIEKQNDAYYAEVAQYVSRYRRQVADRLQASDSELWKMFGRHTVEYFQSVKNRGPAKAQGKELKRRPP